MENHTRGKKCSVPLEKGGPELAAPSLYKYHYHCPHYTNDYYSYNEFYCFLYCHEIS